jgi:hypothetical protein
VSDKPTIINVSRLRSRQLYAMYAAKSAFAHAAEIGLCIGIPIAVVILLAWIFWHWAVNP